MLSRTEITLVLLPGMDGSGMLFVDFIAALGDGYTPKVIAYPSDQDLHYDDLVAFVRSRLPTGQPYVLLGESFSGPVAIALAAERPDGLVGLILSCTFARNPAPLLRHGAGLLPFVPVSSRLAGLLAPLLFGGHATTALRRGLRSALRSALDPLRPSVLRTRMRAVLGVDYADRLRDIAVPVLYLQAAQDRVVTRASAQCIAAALPSMTVSVLRGPHLLLQAMPQAAAMAVRQFIEPLIEPVAAGTPSQPGR